LNEGADPTHHPVANPQDVGYHPQCTGGEGFLKEGAGNHLNVNPQNAEYIPVYSGGEGSLNEGADPTHHLDVDPQLVEYDPPEIIDSSMSSPPVALEITYNPRSSSPMDMEV